MTSLPSIKTPLNQHSLEAIELWLKDLGAERSNSNPCHWNWVMPTWSAQIFLETESLRIIWQKNEGKYECVFPYGLSRQDVQAAFYEGP